MKQKLDKNSNQINIKSQKNDHRLINQSMKIFGFSKRIGTGLPIWLPGGTIIKEEIKKYLHQKEWEYDYQRVETPILGTVNLYKKSGHWDHYRKDMFPAFKWDNENKEEMVLRPMNCPHHICIYKQTVHSYRDLPIRLAEHAHQYRFEPSGSLSGLERVRSMELTDSHIFVRPDQIESEFKQIYQMIKEVLETFKIKIDYLSFSVRDPKNKKKYYPDDEMWNNAERSLEKVLKDLKLDYKKVEGEAAFYGPKLDVQIKNASGHEVTISTIQLDFLLPERFDINYIDEKGKPQRPIMIHRGLIGTYERFIATLLEQTSGQLPLWLAPEQVTLIPVAEANHSYVEEIRLALKKAKIRTHIDKREERLGKKIRDVQLRKVPYQLVIGDKEQKAKVITYRRFGQQESHTIPLPKFIEQLKTEITQKA